MKTLTLFKLILLAPIFLHQSYSVAEEMYGCSYEKLDHVQYSSCLSSKYKEVDVLLKTKMDQLLGNAMIVDVGVDQPKLIKRIRHDLINALRQSDTQWRALLDTECSKLVVFSYGTGSYADIGMLECRISLTNNRLKYISVSDPYAWLEKK